MLRRFISFPLLATCWLSFAAYADDPDLASIRTEFRRAYQRVINSDSAASIADSDALRAYILYPYLQRIRIQRALENEQALDAADRDAAAFLTTHGNEPVARALRQQWYASLAQRRQWERLLANYRDVNDATLRCHALTARIVLERFDDVQKNAIAMWSNAPGSLQACETPFEWLQSQNALTPTLIENRIRLALNAGNPAFAKQLFPLLPKETVVPLENWARLIEQPRRGIDDAIANPHKTIEPDALFDGWTRFVRGDPGNAHRRYRELIRARRLDDKTASRYALELALALSWSRLPEALHYFEQVRVEDIDDRGAEWYARAAIWDGKWQRAAKVIDGMSDSLRQQTRWQYWAARVDEHLGHRSKALARYTALLDDDNYYAALAAARLKRKYVPRQQALTVDRSRVLALAERPAFQRARELLAVELRDEANDEWRFGYRNLDADARAQAIALAADWHWYDQAILTAADQKIFDDYALLYPHPFDAEVTAAARLTKLSVPLIYSVVRQESLYRNDALSTAGAQGLMQLRAATAELTARRWKLSQPSDLFDANANVSIGAAHLRDLVDRFDGKTAVALAAYNAGPGAAKRWLPSTPKDIDVWIENIPYNETRTYVQRVLWHSVVFGWLLNDEAQDTGLWLTRVRASRQ